MAPTRAHATAPATATHARASKAAHAAAPAAARGAGGAKGRTPAIPAAAVVGKRGEEGVRGCAPPPLCPGPPQWGAVDILALGDSGQAAQGVRGGHCVCGEV